MPQKTKFKAALAAARKRLLEVASALTGKDFASDDTFVLATSGRCEYRNKGIDVFLDSLSHLAEMKPCKNVLAYVMVPAWCDKARPELQIALAEDKKTALHDPWITHSIHNPFEDPIANKIRSLDLPDNVTVIYVPCYLNGADGIFDMDYYSLLIGMDATVFPSYYEPWGYTPLESVAFGVPTVTTSLSGFGQWVNRSFNSDFSDCGVNVIERTDSNYNDVAFSIARSVKFLTCADSSSIATIAKQARNTAQAAKWTTFVKFYEKAFKIALENESKRCQRQ